MIRHPLVRILQLLLAVAVALLGALVQARPRAPQDELRFTVSLVGERENDDGSWQGMDLLAERSWDDPDQFPDRFQLNIRPLQRARLLVDELTPDGPRRIYPALGERGVVEPGVTYALPAPHAFYGRDGAARLRVTLEPVDAPAGPAALATPTGSVTRQTYRLSDGAPATVREALYRGDGRISLELDLPCYE